MKIKATRGIGGNKSIACGEIVEVPDSFGITLIWMGKAVEVVAEPDQAPAPTPEVAPGDPEEIEAPAPTYQPKRRGRPRRG